MPRSSTTGELPFGRIGSAIKQAVKMAHRIIAVGESIGIDGAPRKRRKKRATAEEEEPSKKAKKKHKTHLREPAEAED